MTSEAEVTPGRAAFEAFHTQMKTMANPSSGWDHASDAQRVAWEAAASAAVTLVLTRAIAFEEKYPR